MTSAAPGVESALTRARREAGLTEKELAERLGVALWELERAERGLRDQRPFLAALKAEATDGAPAPVARAPRRPAPATEDATAASTDREPPLTWPVLLVAGSLVGLVTIRLFTEVIHVLPRAANVIDVPIIIALAGAALLRPQTRKPVEPRWLLPLASLFLLLCTVALVVNPSRVELGPALLFVYGILSPLLVYGAVYRLWPAGRARWVSGLIVALGILQLVVVFTYQLPTFFFDGGGGSAGVDRIGGTFGTNGYQLVFFLLAFVAILASIYTFEPQRRIARVAPLLIAGALAAIIFVQYRALLITMAITLVLLVLMLGTGRRGTRGRGLVSAIWALVAFVVVVGIAATQFPVLKVNQFLELNPVEIVDERLDIIDQLDDLYSDEPRAIVTGTGPGTFSSRAWYTFSHAESESRSNAVGSYVLRLTSGRLYSTDVSERYVTPRASASTLEAVAGSSAVNSPFSSYISIAAETGVLGLLTILAIYGGMLLLATVRARLSIRAATPGDALPGLMLAAAVGFFVLVQMALLNNWLEVTRLTFITWGLLAIANREFEARSERPAPAVAAAVAGQPRAYEAAPPPPARANLAALNEVSFEELRATGLSVSQAQRVLKYRRRIGGFESLDQLDALPGLPRQLRSELKRRFGSGRRS